MNIPTSVTPLQRKILALAEKVVGNIDGEPITRFERLLMRLEASAPDNPAIAKPLLDLFGQASRDKVQTDIRVLGLVLEYKDKWGPTFKAAEKAGRPSPLVYPHPDDFIICPDCSVRIDGPKTADEAKALETVINCRDVLFLIAEEFMDYPDDVCPLEERRKEWVSLRRKFYRMHRRIPRRLHKPFPPFRTVPREEQEDDV